MEQLSDEILAQITDYARLFFSVDETAIIAGIDPKKAKHWYRIQEHPFRLAYLKGRLLTDAEVRKTTITLAKQGSTPAVEQVKKYMRDSSVKNG